MDTKKIEHAVMLLLEGMGEDVEREGLLETPKRVAKMYEELLGGMKQSGENVLEKTFTSNYSEFILVKDIEFYSLCEHHILPFCGKVHIAYVPEDKVLGLSKLGRLVDIYSKRLQIQERMTEQLAEAIMKNLSVKGVLVYVEAEHLCMQMRGVKKRGSKSISVATKGMLRDNQIMRAEILNIINFN